MTPEGKIKSDICQYLTARGIYHRVIQIGGIRGRSNTGKGISDILAILQKQGGRLAAIEVKTPEGRTSKEQDEFLFNVRAHGGIGIVARSVDDVIAAGIY